MLLRRQVSEERDEHIDMTPMVDVVFQLMTFMLFTSQMGGELPVEVPPASHGVGVEDDTATFLTLLKPEGPGAPPRILLGKAEELVKDEGQPLTLDQVKKAVAEGAAEGKRRVVLQADGGVPHGEVLKLAAAVTEAEGVTLHIGVKEPDR